MNSLIVLSSIKLIYSNLMLHIVSYAKYTIDIFFFNIYRWITRMNLCFIWIPQVAKYWTLKTVVNIGQINLERGKSFIQQLLFAKDMTFVIFMNKIQ